MRHRNVFPARIFSLCLYWLCTGGIEKHIKQREKCQLLCGDDEGENVEKELFAIFILSVFHQTRKDEDVKGRKKGKVVKEKKLFSENAFWWISFHSINNKL